VFPPATRGVKGRALLLLRCRRRQPLVVEARLAPSANTSAVRCPLRTWPGWCLFKPKQGREGRKDSGRGGEARSRGSVNLRTQHGRGKPTRTFGDFEPEPASAGGERKRWWPSISLPPCMGVQQTSGRQGSLGWSPPSKLFFFRLLFIEKNDYSRKRDEAPGILAILNAANF